MSNKTIVFYHAGCLDGLAAAYAAFLSLGDTAEYKAIAYSTEIDPYVYLGCTVYVLDFSFKRDVYLTLSDLAAKVIVLDHHKTAHEEIGDLVHIDQTKSGAVLSWEHFHPDVDVPDIFKFIQDRDLWQWQYPETKAVNMYLYSKPMQIDVFGETIKEPLSAIVEKGQVLVDYLDKEVLVAAKRKRMFEFLGHYVPIVNTNAYITSELGNYLAEEHGMAILYNDSSDKRLFSLRSSKDSGIDVSRLAEVYGGGGHGNAAGFSLSLDSPLLDNFLHEIKNEYPDTLVSGHEVFLQSNIPESDLPTWIGNHGFPSQICHGYWLRSEVEKWMRSR